MSQSNVGVIILAAGEGKRMKSDIPKMVHELNGKALVEHVLDNALASGICTKPIVVVSPRHTAVQDRLGDRATYTIQEEQIGTGNATMAAEVAADSLDDIVVLYGDMPLLSSDSIKRLVEHHQKTDATITLLTAVTPDFEDWRAAFDSFGRIVRNGQGTIERIVEYRDATEAERQIRELSTCFFAFKADWLWEHLKGLDNDNDQDQYLLVDLVQVAMEQNKPIELLEIDVKEVIGINSQRDLALAKELTQ